MHRTQQLPQDNVLSVKIAPTAPLCERKGMHWHSVLIAGAFASSALAAAVQQPYSIWLDEAHPANESAIRRLRGFEGGLTDTIPGFPYVLTVYDLVKTAVEEYRDKDCLGSRRLVRKIEEEKNVTKVINGVETQVPKKWVYSELSPYEYRSYRDMGAEASSIGAGLRKLGLAPGDRIGLYADTSYIPSSHS
jgi:long-chain acyl-CoA synthetase